MRRYREVLCPTCRKKHMTAVEAYNVRICKEGRGFSFRCPGCDTRLIVEEHVLEGKTEADYKEGDLEIMFYLS